MDETLVFDAYSIINIMRIDSDNEFLEDWIRNKSPKIAETVIREVMDNYNKNPLDNDVRERINKNAPMLYCYQTTNEEISSFDQNIMMNELVKFSNHQKKPNGELFSAGLCLKEHKESGKMTLFITDDYPAHKEFSEYFSLHQIGYIIDTVDLLLIIYHRSKDASFSKYQLIEYITRMKRRYGSEYIEIIENVKAIADKLVNRKKAKDKKLGYKLYNITEGLVKNPELGITELKKVIVDLNDYDSKLLKYKLESLKADPPAIFKKLSHIEYALKNFKIYRSEV